MQVTRARPILEARSRISTSSSCRTSARRPSSRTPASRRASCPSSRSRPASSSRRSGSSACSRRATSASSPAPSHAIAPNRDIGLQVGGQFRRPRVNYAVAYLNGSNDGSNSESFAVDRIPTTPRNGRAAVHAALRRERRVCAARASASASHPPTPTRRARRRRRCCPPTRRRRRRTSSSYRTGATATTRATGRGAPRTAALLLRRALRAP